MYISVVLLLFSVCSSVLRLLMPSAMASSRLFFDFLALAVNEYRHFLLPLLLLQAGRCFFFSVNLSLNIFVDRYIIYINFGAFSVIEFVPV